jgi:mRNA interferase RelE/StbE
VKNRLSEVVDRLQREHGRKVAAAAVEFIYGAPATNPHRVGRPLRFELEGRHSAHRGDYRVVYRIDDRQRRVYVEVIGHRADIYR